MDVVRQLKHQAIDDPEFAHQYAETVCRLEQPTAPTAAPMIRRGAPCPYCDDCSWHGVPSDCGCKSSAVNLRD